MSDVSDEAIRAYWKEHREQLRQCETQRSTLTNLLIVVTAALSALIVQQKFTINVVPLCIFVVLTGAYGAVAVSKYYERASYHLSQARALTADLVTRGVLGPKEGLEQARGEHNRRFPRLHRVRLHRLWVVLHLAIALYGVCLFCVCVAVA
ncbi:hypothetical protein [Streptomyces zaomyceticus]|uniref:hypothetical protein n=1 Tax=Streptomyces zaomyceticus TaxID=68286 RepID=UPI001675A272|nr:hypothetical protein [Streptomyces zaomyceticus]GHG24719.1 hypothetical protein GCM10018791_45470 [Streptomyces zaomyceticus]